MLASIVQSPDLAIDEDEAEKLAKGIANVARHYDLPQVAQKTVDWVGLIQVVGTIYGPRFVAASMRRREARAKTVNPTVRPVAPNAPARAADVSQAAQATQETHVSPSVRMPPNVFAQPTQAGARDRSDLAQVPGARGVVLDLGGTKQ